MSRQGLQRKRRGEQRRAAELESAGEERRTVRFAVVGPTILVVAALAGLTYAVAGGGAGSESRVTDTASPGESASAPFGPHYPGLAQRRQAAHIPTMMSTMNSRAHAHPLLKVQVDGRRVTVPANIGIDPGEDPMQMAGLHTHDTSGTIHVEGVPGARLGQFFAIWGVPFSAGRLGPYRRGAHGSIRMWVDGKPSTAFGALELVDGQRIVVRFRSGQTLK